MMPFLHVLSLWFFQIFGIDPLYTSGPGALPSTSGEESAEAVPVMILIPTDRISNGF